MSELIRETDLGVHLLVAVSGVRRALRRRVGRTGGVADLTDAQRELVRLVRRNPNIRVRDAAAGLHLAPNTVSTLVSALCAAGWLRRETDPEDARSALLLLTPSAQTHVAEWRDRRLTALNEALAGLNESDLDAIRAAIPALQRLVEGLEEVE